MLNLFPLPDQTVFLVLVRLPPLTRNFGLSIIFFLLHLASREPQPGVVCIVVIAAVSLAETAPCLLVVRLVVVMDFGAYDALLVSVHELYSTFALFILPWGWG